MGRYLGNAITTNTAMAKLRLMYRAGMVPCTELVLKKGDRLDKVAAREMGDSRLWWMIASVSLIGFAIQVPEGTVVRVPKRHNELLAELGVGGSY